MHDLTVKDDQLVVSTHGRSFWIFDDLALLREPLPSPMTREGREGFYLFPVPDAVRWGGAAARPTSGRGRTRPAAPLVLRPDPRLNVSPADLEEELRFNLQVRDAITRLTRGVVRLQTVRRQLAERNELLAREEKARPLREAADGLIKKLDILEARMHNPKAEIAYDVLAMKGGAMLYSRLSPFLNRAGGGNGAPTQGMREVFAEQVKELEGLESELAALLGQDLAALNRTAAGLGVPGIWVPAK